MSNQSLNFAPESFRQLVDSQRALIHLSNELEQELYRVGDRSDPERLANCQRAASALIGMLRQSLFFYDQHVLPLLEQRSSRQG